MTAEHGGTHSMTSPLPRILLINPNSSAATTAMMVAIAAACCHGRAEIVGATAMRAPAMIVDGAALAASADEVVEIARAQGDGCDGIIVAAFGDPGAAEIRSFWPRPVVGIGEASMREAARTCITEDGAAAVIIGGGPLAQAADRLQPQFEVPIIKPIAAAVTQLLQRLGA